MNLINKSRVGRIKITQIKGAKMSLFFIKIVFNFPIMCFILGVLLSFIKEFRFPQALQQFFTTAVLFCVGLKGGGALVEHTFSDLSLFLTIVTFLACWGLLQPLFSFYILRSFFQLDVGTAAAVAASLGSVSVMTFIAAIAFLDELQVPYEDWMIAVLAIMEIPAIVSGIFLAKAFTNLHSFRSFPIFFGSIFNRVVLTVLVGIICGFVGTKFYLLSSQQVLLSTFHFLVALLLFDLGISVGLQRKNVALLSLPLNFFGLCTSLVGGGVGILFSYFIGLPLGTGTLVAVLTASASYIAVPAAMRIAVPEAKEAIYLPISLGVVFPFNVMIGVPLYYYFYTWILR